MTTRPQSRFYIATVELKQAQGRFKSGERLAWLYDETERAMVEQVASDPYALVIIVSVHVPL